MSAAGPTSETERASAGDGARRILSNTAFRTVADIGSKVASLVLYVVMARELGPGGFGVFTFSMTLVLLVATAARLGQPSVLTREVARDHDRVHEYFANTLALQAVVAVPVLLLVVLVGPLTGMDATTQAVCALLGIAVVGEAMLATVFGVLQAYERMVYVPFVLISQRWSIAGGGILALLLGAGVVTVSAVYLAGTLLGLGLGIWTMARRVVRPRAEVDRRRWWPLLKAAFPVGMAGLFATLLFRIDVALLGAFEPEEVVGAYGAAFRLFDGSLFLSWAVAAALYPVFARLAPGTEHLRVILARGVKLGAALVFPLGAGALVLAGPVVDLLYGDGYEESKLALVLLAPAIATFPIAYTAGQFLVAQDRQRELLYINAGLAVQNLSFNLVLIPLYSLDGAAISTASTQLLASGLLLWRASSAVGGADLPRMLAGPLAGTLAAALVMLVLREVWPVAVVAGALAHLLVLAAVERTAFREDADLVQDIIRRRAGGRPEAAGT